MTNPEFYGQLALTGVGLITLATSGGVALGVKRLLHKTDALAATVGVHGERLAAMEVRLPNGEWKELKGSVAELAGEVRESRGELSKHILDETQAMADMRGVVSSCQSLLATTYKPSRVRKASSKRKARR